MVVAKDFNVLLSVGAVRNVTNNQVKQTTIVKITILMG